MPEIEITNMVMIQDETGNVLVQDRIKNWQGITFPGGHVNDGESVFDSSVREIKEETGLDIKNIKSCGFIHWFNTDTKDRYFSFLFKTEDFSGNLIEETDEGKVFWTSLEEMRKMKLSPNFKEYLPLFLEDKYKEGFFLWENKDPWVIKSIEYK